MKKSIFLTLFVIAIAAASTFAQTSEYTRSKSLKLDEVPVTIREAFQNEVGTWTDKGYWTETYIETKNGSKITFTPVHYTFFSKKNKEKVKFMFSPEGKLEQSSGLSANGKK
jgi:hypothetical protein